MALTLPIKASEVRAASQVPFARRGYPEPATPDTDDPLQRVVNAATTYVAKVTGRDPLNTVPDDLADIAWEAVRMRTEQAVMQGRPSAVSTATDDLVVSFSAGSYSETRRELASKRTLNSWPALAELLWLLMTDDQYDLWVEIMTGVVRPADGITEVDWGTSFDPAPGDWPSWRGLEPLP